ncbi:universal stress protein [Histidinibacterium lentulum]|uniref:Universal stress protein n=1 Tax=Histidinibacterium lentulum TaxID=2480588 RepID=A0A3N2RA62_9RHOB|nr:universal stress protein [Histidinibacterium lentulum]ROU04291.1 universal stress protein [Histidinibacterium lentulum]
MFSKIMVPVDLGHADKLGKALGVASQMARNSGAEVVYVGVTGSAPTRVAHTPEDYAAKLDAFAAEQAETGGHAAAGHAMVSHDPATDLDASLAKAAEETGADLVVMATHVPGAFDAFGPNHGGALARHSKISVFLVRGA